MEIIVLIIHAIAFAFAGVVISADYGMGSSKGRLDYFVGMWMWLLSPLTALLVVLFLGGFGIF